jgi:hypothetical protein
MTKDEFLEARELGLTFNQIGEVFNLTERQVNYRSKSWGLDFSKKKELNNFFFSSNTKASNYWAGFIAADGWIEKDRSRIGLALQKLDVEHLEKFKKAVSSSHDICPFMNNTAYRIRFNSSQMVSDLLEYFNITPTKTFTYTMPLFSEDYLMLEFLRGYIEGDGHLHKTNSNRVDLGLCSASYVFLEDFKSICETLLNRSISQNPVLNVNKKGQVYNIRLNLRDSEDLINLLYMNSTYNTRLNRKFEIASLVIR